MALKEITLRADRKCSNCKQLMLAGEQALYISNEEMTDRVIVHVSCPAGVPKAFTRWKRPDAPPQIKKLEVRCTMCHKVFDSPADKGVPFRCHFCGVIGVCESTARTEEKSDERA